MKTSPFYIQQSQIKRVKTAIPTGTFDNPLDFANSLRPWVMVTAGTKSFKTSAKKKILIFTDSLYKKRSRYDQKALYEKLLNRKQEEFRILIPLPNGDLQEWDGEQATLEQVADFEKYNKKAIYNAAFKRYGLNKRQLFLLDHFSVDNLLDDADYSIHWNTFSTGSVDIFHAFEKAADPNDFCLTFNTLEEIKEFLSLDRHKLLTHPLFKKLKKINIYSKEDLRLTDGILSQLFELVPDIEKIDLAYHHIYEEPRKLQPNTLKKLKEINFFTTSGEDVSALCHAAPNIEKIKLRYMNFWGNEKLKLPPNLLKKLKELNLSSSEFTENDLVTLCQAAPNIEKISFSGCHHLENMLEKIPSHTLKKLKEINLSNAYFTANSLANLFHRVPNLEILNLTLSNCGSIAGLLKTLKPNSLKKLKKINLFGKSVTKDDLNALSLAAPFVEEIELEWLRELENLPINSLTKKLKHIELSGIFLDSNRANHLCEATPNLERICFMKCTGFENFKPNSLKKISYAQIEADTITTEELIALYRAAPAVKTIDLLGCRSIMIDPAALPQELLKIIKFGKFKQGDYASALQKISSKTLPDSYLDTRPSNSTLECKRYFPDKEPSLYRLYSWQPNLDTLEARPDVFKPDDLQPKPINTKDYSIHPHFDCSPGIKDVEKKDGTEIILPSLDCEEEIFDLRIIDRHGNVVPLDQLKMKYSPSTRFHQLILPYAGQFTVHFKVAVPKHKPTLPLHLQKTRRTYNAHKYNPLAPQQTFHTLREFGHYIDQYETGACRHLAIAAYSKLLAEDPTAKIYIIGNDAHMFIEVETQGRRYKLDLGGYPADIKDIPIKTITPSAGKESKEPEIKEIEMREVTDCSLDDALNHTATALIDVSSDMAYQQILADLQHIHGAAKVFIANHPEDLNLSGTGIKENGTLQAAHTPFSQWLNAHQQGVIVVDIRDLDDSEVAQLNDLLDRRIEHKQIPDGVRIVLINYPNQKQYGPDFIRRVPRKALAEAKEEFLLKDDDEVPPTDAHHEVIEIDLFQSYHWQRYITGTWQLFHKPHEDKLSFQWIDAKLLKLLKTASDKHRHIIFKNPPLHDAQFNKFIAELQSLRRCTWADQQFTIPNTVHFYQKKTSGYDWKTLAKHATIQSFFEEKTAPYVLSDATILSFIQDPFYEFSQTTGKLESTPSYFSHYKDKKIDIVCAPNLTKGTLAQLLTEAAKQNVTVRFVTHGMDTLPSEHPLHHLHEQLPDEEKPSESFSPANVMWELHEDVYFATQKMLAEHPGASYVPLDCLEASELGRFPILSTHDREQFLKTSKLALTAQLSDIVKKLLNNQTVILSGSIPPALHDALTSLTLGYIEGKRFTGKLIILTSPEEEQLAHTLTGKQLISSEFTHEEKIALLKKMYPETHQSLEEKTASNFATVEREFLQAPLYSEPSNILDASHHLDEIRAKQFDEERLRNVEHALNISPWVMIESPTGTGKTHFLHHILPQEKTCFNLEEWLNPNSPKTTLVIDEANFMSELDQKGTNFLERFKSLKANPPSFYWQGKDYPLTSQKKLIVAFNPDSYSAARVNEGFLTEHKLSVPFQPLPDYYLRARIIMPLLHNSLKKYNTAQLRTIAQPILKIYQWLLMHSNLDAPFVTPREIKAIVHLIAHRIAREPIQDLTILRQITDEIAYDIGKQTLADHSALLKAFQQEHPAPKKVKDNLSVPKHYLPHQYQTYRFIQNMLEAKDALAPRNSDLGLGGIILQGGSEIGKTHFINQVAKDYERRAGKIVYRISPSTPFHEKEKILRAAAQTGALIVAEEFNTSLWPNKLLNNMLVGLDEYNKPLKKPVLLLATQNPTSFAGRLDDDPALRRRLVKLNLTWPVFQSKTEPRKEHKTKTHARLFKTTSSKVMAANSQQQPVTVDSTYSDLSTNLITLSG